MKRGRARALIVVVLCAACGGTSVGELFDAPSDAGTGAPLDASSSVDAGAADDASSRRDARAHDAASKPDSNGTIDVRLGCSPRSGHSCDLQTEICCRGATGYVCQAPQAQCTGLQIPCAQASDCAARGLTGDVCCGAFDSNNRIYDVSCIPSDQCLLENMHVVVCNPDDTDPCPNEGKCAYSMQSLPGFGLCL